MSYGIALNGNGIEHRVAEGTERSYAWCDGSRRIGRAACRKNIHLEWVYDSPGSAGTSTPCPKCEAKA